ncbi:ferritin family protein [Caloramator sp. E03]|uniref:ferritin family protein n=1 Tax=Caloramator sp. E03 TaxID=2576307 RepID=UPI001A9B91EB|nr:ferritin-like domain-containing protein [Caloramator sp. E03]
MNISPLPGMLCNYDLFQKSLMLIKEAVQDERKDELFYDYLISVAPNQEAKQIIESIRNDERRHNQIFRAIYKNFTGQDIQSVDEPFEKPSSYLDGLKMALKGELSAVVKYRQIKEGLPLGCYQDQVFNIITDELRHSSFYNYLITFAK